jgi:hypothetical protein
MTQAKPGKPDGGTPPVDGDGADGHGARKDRNGGSGEGADTALEALIRKRKQAEAPIDPADLDGTRRG